MAVVLLGAALLAGCGEFVEQSGDDIVSGARADMGEVRAMHIRAEQSENGRTESRDLVLTRLGGCEGTVSVGGSSIKIIRLNARTYVKPDESYWPLILGGDDGPIVSTVGGRWILFSDATDQRVFDRFCDFDEALDSVLDRDGDWDFEAGDTTQEDGVLVVAVSGRIDDRLDLDLVVRAERPNYVEQLTMSGEARAAVDFFEFDSEPGLQEPGEGQSIRIEDLR